MKTKDLKIKDEFTPDWMLGIKDSMQLDSGQEVCSLTVEYHNKTIRAYVMVLGDVVVDFKEDQRYKAASQFPQELLDYFAGKRPDLEEDVNVINNNWFELFIDDSNDENANNCQEGEVLDDFEDFNTKENVRQWLQDSIEEWITAHQEKNDRELEAKWDEFGDIPIDSDNCIEIDWWIFEKGTEREYIWHYFDEKHSKGVHYLLYEYRLYKDLPTSDLFQAVCNGCSKETILDQAEAYIEKDCIREFLLACLGVTID